MKVVATALPDVLRVEPTVYEDDRGWFMETWNRDRAEALGLPTDFVQHNQSRSRRAVLRGLHYQVESPQGKLVRVVRGAILDVAVDLRRSSPTFGRWVAEELTEANRHQLWIPPGFAHGFLVLSDEADVVYGCTDRWAPAHERTLLWSCPDVGIPWPIAPGVPPILSSKDEAGLPLRQAECYA